MSFHFVSTLILTAMRIYQYACISFFPGAFLIPYAIMLTFVGIPVFFIELATGQYSASGPMTVWEAAPLFQGVGFGMLIISFIGSIYYNMIIAWSLYYMFASWQKVLPWSHCNNKYNTAGRYLAISATSIHHVEIIKTGH